MAKSTQESSKISTPQPINPFFTTLNGITTLFSGALSVGIVILLISALGSIPSMLTSNDTDTVTVEEFNSTLSTLQPQDYAFIAFVTLVIIVFAVVVGAMLHGIQSYTALQLARNQRTTIGEAFSAVLSRFGGYLLLYIWMNIKIALWTLLFIIPGINAYFRYFFAGMLFFDKDNLQHEAALKESSRLTRGGLMTLFSSNLLFNIITLGYIANIVSIATQSELYRTYTAYDQTNTAKPPIHWLSWFTLALPFLFIAAIFIFTVIIAIIIGLAGGFAT